MKKYQSFGKYPLPNNQEIKLVFNQNINFQNNLKSYLPYGLGKSYGDSCLNSNNILLDCSYMNKFISFDEDTQILKAEAGVTLKEIIDVFLPRAYFLPVTPGTKLITLGGAIANDVHGKNHHKYGTFGRYILSFDLLRSDGNIYHCSSTENIDLYNATIGGLGLTGVILNAELKLIKVAGPLIDAEFIKFYSFEEFFEINTNSQEYDYTVAWVNTSKFGSGIYSRGNFANADKQIKFEPNLKGAINFPIEYDFINPLSVKVFNFLYFGKQFKKSVNNIISFEPFFYPLDAVNEWNKAYGKRGFLQYQFAIPFENSLENLKNIFKIIADSGYSSFLTVLKTFGNLESPGMLSFPIEGITLAIDFKMVGDKLLTILNKCDDIVVNAGGRLYPAKDARMNSEHFKKFYPKYKEFIKFIDPKFNSDFWRRVIK